jgi:RimJ/RimL family protein N-acetyltransferase
MATAFAVRPARPADLDRLVGLVWEVAAEGRWIATEVPFDRAQRRERMAERLADPDAAMFVAEAGSRLVGQVGVHRAPWGVADLGMLVVAAWRGRGVGSALLAAALGWARRHGAHKVALEVWPHNTAALALYRKFGFVEEGRLRRHYRRRDGQLWDALVLGLELDPAAPPA